jgi:thiamine biosynthesis lipoprotein
MCEDAVHATYKRMEELISRLSRHDAQSELSVLNSAGFLLNPSNDIHKVLLLAEHVSKLTHGAFDITILPLQQLYMASAGTNSRPSPEQLNNTIQLVDYRKVNNQPDTIRFEKQGMAITLDGIGKGYIVDQGVEVLRSKGFANVYVEAGGDLMVSGTKPAGTPWRIGIGNPRPEKESHLTILELSNKAVATSGDYMQAYSTDLQHHHIIDPRSGFSPPELASATVTAPTVALADALATAAMVLGPKRSIQVLGSLGDCEGYFVGKDLQKYSTEGFLS